MSRSFFLLAALAAFICFNSAIYSQSSLHARTLLTSNIEENNLVTLYGNTPYQANAASDQGAVDDSFRLDHILLQLKRPVEVQAALELFIEELHNPKSPSFHKWLTGQQFGKQFGLAPEDLVGVSSWLESHGFAVNGIYPNSAIEFSGTAGQIRSAFHTQIHHVVINGEEHYANMTDPQIPAALSQVISGTVSLNDLKAHPFVKAVPAYASGNGRQLVTPSDLATIYNLNNSFAAGWTGQGQTIAVLEHSDLYTPGDWLVFRKTFGLARAYPKGALVTVHPQGLTGSTCTDPGVNGDDQEAIVDAEYASAAAPNATIEVAAFADTTVFGGFIALQNLLASSAPPAIVSIGFGIPEAQLGAAGNAYISSLYQMAVAEGVSIFVSTGDSGAALADGNARIATHGISVSGYASTPYNVAVGATDFADEYFGSTSNYWSSTNTSTFGSALRYVPEIPWNDSCANELLAGYSGFATTYGSNGYCNQGGSLTIAASSGGPSACATGSPNAPGLGGNTCAGYPKPAWQQIPGNPADGVRDIPDVSLFGSNGVWGHYYVACFSDVYNGGSSCLGAPSTWSGLGGTSLSAPVMAGIQALINQKTRSAWGNPNPVYYSLALAEYGGSASCNSTASPSNSCLFHDITMGDIDVVCEGTNNCFFGPTPVNYGVLSVSNTSYQPAYPAGPGWDFATGIGSVNAWNLIANWPTAGALSAQFQP